MKARLPKALLTLALPLIALTAGAQSKSTPKTNHPNNYDVVVNNNSYQLNADPAPQNIDYNKMSAKVVSKYVTVMAMSSKDYTILGICDLAKDDFGIAAEKLKAGENLSETFINKFYLVPKGKNEAFEMPETGEALIGGHNLFSFSGKETLGGQNLQGYSIESLADHQYLLKANGSENALILKEENPDVLSLGDLNFYNQAQLDKTECAFEIDETKEIVVVTSSPGKSDYDFKMFKINGEHIQKLEVKNVVSYLDGEIITTATGDALFNPASSDHDKAPTFNKQKMHPVNLTDKMKQNLGLATAPQTFLTPISPTTSF